MIPRRTFAVILLGAAFAGSARDVRAQGDTTAPTGIRIRIGRDTAPVILPRVQTRADALAYQAAQGRIAAALATAFQLNSRSVIESVWGQVTTRNFATERQSPLVASEVKPTRVRLPGILAGHPGEPNNLSVDLDSRLEFRNEKDESNRCTALFFASATSACRSAFEPTVDFQYALRSAGVVADRVHVNVDYDSQREFDASNTISIAYDGTKSSLLQHVEVGNVTFQPPTSRFITAAIPSGNYGIAMEAKLGPTRLHTILAQQKGNVVRDRVFTVGDQVLQAVDRTVEDYQFEPRRFFFTVDPRHFAGYPNIDILNRRQMSTLAAALPDTLRPVRLYVYRLLIGGQPPNPNGPQFQIIGDPLSRRGQVYEYLREGIDYYADPSRLWIALVRPLSISNERLVVAYRVRINGVETTHVTTGGTPDLEFDPNHAQLANLLWDPSVQPGDAAFAREIRSVYRLGGNDVVRSSVTVKIVTGNGTDQEKPIVGPAQTYLQLFGLAQPTNSSSFDVENRLWPRETDPDFALGVGVFGTRTLRDRFLVFPSVRPFASTGIAGPGNPHNDTLYTTPAEYLLSSQRPGTVYHLRLRYQSLGNGTNGTLALGAVQVRPNSERILVDNVLLARGTDYTVDYDLGRVNFARPDTLFPRPRQVVVQFEENPLFVETPTSIYGGTLQIPLANGELNFLALSQSQRSNYTRPALGLEPQATLIGGVSTVLTFDAEPLTRLVSRLPYGATNAPSRVSLAAEFAASKPQPGSGQQAYLESFEGSGGLDVRLDDQFWYYSSRPATGHVLLGRVGANALDSARATSLAYQTNVRDPQGHQLQFTIDKIDPASALTGTGLTAPEEILWLTMFPLSTGLLTPADSHESWQTGTVIPGRRWRSVRTQLSPSGSDVSRTENLEFWALVHTRAGTLSKNPTLVFDVGEISENSVALQPDTVTLRRNPGAAAIDTLLSGRRYSGYDRLDSERDPFSRAFNANANDNGLPGDVVESPIVVVDTVPGRPAVVRADSVFRRCRAQFAAIYGVGDTRADCTVANGRLDEEDLDGDNVLNLTSAQRESEQISRYIVDLSDQRRFNRVGGCVASERVGAIATTAPGDSLCWVFVRLPFRSPDDSVNSPALRRARALRITMISGTGLGDNEFDVLALDRLRLSGAPWLKRADVALHGVAGEQQAGGFVSVGTIGTQDKNVRTGVSYESPPGVTDLPDLKQAQLTQARVLVNEHSLRIVAGNLAPFDRAEAYYRFPEGQKNFLGYKELRLWARGVSDGWGPDGELEFYVKLGHDANNFYLYHTPLNGGTGKEAWRPEIRLDFNRIIALRAAVQNAYLHNRPGNTCTGLDSAIVANTSVVAATASSALYAACANGYIVYSIDPGVNPPNLAAIQELDVGMMRTRVGGSSRPIVPGDTLELWVDDIRLGGAVSTAGYAGQVALGITASDFGEVRINAVRRDPNFRQLGDAPSYLTDNSLDVSAGFRLEKLFPRSLGYSIPVTFNYSGASSNPYYLTQTDVDASAVPGLRTPRSVGTSVSIGVRRSVPLQHGVLAPLLNNLAFNSTYTLASARSEFEDGRAHDFRAALDYNLLRAVAPSLATALPTEIVLSTAYERGSDRRTAFLKPGEAEDDTTRLVAGFTNLLRNGGALAIHPLPGGTLRVNVTSVRDLRGYNDSPVLGLIDLSERDRFAGLDAGLERERDVGTLASYSATVLRWLRVRANMNANYNMLRDPNTLSFVRSIDSTGLLHIPRKLANTQNTEAGITIDFPAMLRGKATPPSFARRLLGALQPLDVSLDRNVLTAYDGGPAAAPLAYQLGVGGIGAFRHIGAEAATSAGVNTQFGFSQTINLPAGATVTTRYQRVALRNWTQRTDNLLDVGDATQRVFPDIAFRWGRRIETPGSILTSFQTSARMTETRQLLSSPGEFDVASGDNGETDVRTFPLSFSGTWAGSRPLTTTFGANIVRRIDHRPGADDRGTNVDVNGDIARAFALPAAWHPRGDLHTRFSFQDSHGLTYVFDPLAIGTRSRLTDNGRRSYTLTADTDVSEEVNSSLVVSRVSSFDRNLSREFTQTVLSAIVHLKFFAGDLH